MPTVKKLTGRNAVDMGFRKRITAPIVPTKEESAPEQPVVMLKEEQRSAVVARGARLVQKIEAVPVAQKRPKLRVCYYVRTSTLEESQRSSIEGQQTHFESLIASHDDWQLTGAYVEDGVSGTNAVDRPELQRMLRDCRDHKLDLILTKSISRFARNTTDCLEMVRELSALGVALFFEREKIDTRTMGSDLILTFLSCFAAEESKSISANIRWGLKRRFQSGTYRLNLLPYGYEKAADGTFTIIPEQAEVVRQIFDFALSGLGAANIAHILNDRGIPTQKGKTWYPRAILNILHNEFYMGDWLLQKTYSDETYTIRKNKGQLDQYYLPDHHAPIISQETFEKANEAVAQHSKECGERTPAPCYPFRGKLFCAECGAPLIRSGKMHICDGFVRKNTGCEKGTRVLEDDVKNSFVTMLNKLAFSQRLAPPNRILDVFIGSIRQRERAQNKERLEEIDGEMEALQREIEKIAPTIWQKPLNRKTLNELRARVEALRKEKNSLETRVTDTEKAERLRSYLNHRDEGERDFPDTAFTEFILRAVVKAGQYIDFTFTCGITLRESIARTTVQNAAS